MTQPRIVSTPDIVGGKPRVDGTRISVALILTQFMSGENIDSILEAYPTLSADDVLTALTYAIDCVDPEWNRFDEWMDTVGGWTTV